MAKFTNATILSVVSGKLCCRDFGDVHACIEAMAGGPVWTHQIPAWMRANEAKLRAAFPDLAGFDTGGLSAETAAAWMAEREPFLSIERDVPVIGGLPSSPFEGLDPEKTIAVVVP